MTQRIITSAGLAEAVSLNNRGLDLTITNFKLGETSDADVDYTPVSGDTALRGTERYSALITSATQLNDRAINFQIVVGTDIGTFSFNEIGIYTDTGTLFILISLSNKFEKVISSQTEAGNVYRLTVPVQLDASSGQITFRQVQTTEARVSEIRDVNSIPCQGEENSNIYLWNDLNRAQLAYIRSNDHLWSFADYEISHLDLPISNAVFLNNTLSIYTTSEKEIYLSRLGSLLQFTQVPQRGCIRKIRSISRTSNTNNYIIELEGEDIPGLGPQTSAFHLYKHKDENKILNVDSINDLPCIAEATSNVYVWEGGDLAIKDGKGGYWNFPGWNQISSAIVIARNNISRADGRLSFDTITLHTILESDKTYIVQVVASTSENVGCTKRVRSITRSGTTNNYRIELEGDIPQFTIGDIILYEQDSNNDTAIEHVATLNDLPCVDFAVSNFYSFNYINETRLAFKNSNSDSWTLPDFTAISSANVSSIARNNDRVSFTFTSSTELPTTGTLRLIVQIFGNDRGCVREIRTITRSGTTNNYRIELEDDIAELVNNDSVTLYQWSPDAITSRFSSLTTDVNNIIGQVDEFSDLPLPDDTTSHIYVRGSGNDQGLVFKEVDENIWAFTDYVLIEQDLPISNITRANGRVSFNTTIPNAITQRRWPYLFQTQGNPSGFVKLFRTITRSGTTTTYRIELDGDIPELTTSNTFRIYKNRRSEIIEQVDEVSDLPLVSQAKSDIYTFRFVSYVDDLVVHKSSLAALNDNTDRWTFPDFLPIIENHNGATLVSRGSGRTVFTVVLNLFAFPHSNYSENQIVQNEVGDVAKVIRTTITNDLVQFEVDKEISLGNIQIYRWRDDFLHWLRFDVTNNMGVIRGNVTTNTTNITSLRSDIVSIQNSDLTGIRTDIATLRNNVTSNDTDITRLTNQQNQNTIALTTQQTTNTNLRHDIGINQNNIASLRTDMTAAQSNITTLRSDVNSNDTDIGRIDTQVSSHGTTLLDHERKFNEVEDNLVKNLSLSMENLKLMADFAVRQGQN